MNTQKHVWSAEQQNIFQWFAKTAFSTFNFLAIRARAGCAKTTTLFEGIIQAVETNILYVVFNKKNQVEAEQKLATMGTTKNIMVRTWHSLGFYFLKLAWGNRLRADNWVVWEQVEKALQAIENVSDSEMQTARKNKVEIFPKQFIFLACQLIGFCKNTFCEVPTIKQVSEVADIRDIGTNDKLDAKGFTNEKLWLVAMNAMKLALSRDNGGRISFDDMVWLPVALGIVRPTFALICADEYQDSNCPQASMMKNALLPGGRICIVGDDRQAIYSFRGANPKSIDMFKTEFTAMELPLNRTYRCPKTVVKRAAQIVPDYVAHDSAPEGIVEDMPAEKALQSVKVGDAILSRINAPLMGICLGLLKRNIRARIEGRDIGKALTKIVEDIGAKTIPDFFEKLDVWEIGQLKKIAGRNAPSKIQNIQDSKACLETLAEVCNSIPDLLGRLDTLFQDSTYDKNPSVVCSSVHKAKGLEWKNVFLCAETFRGTNPDDEESNILYVAITRAKEHLILMSGIK